MNALNFPTLLIIGPFYPTTKLFNPQSWTEPDYLPDFQHTRLDGLVIISHQRNFYSIHLAQRCWNGKNVTTSYVLVWILQKFRRECTGNCLVNISFTKLKLSALLSDNQVEVHTCWLYQSGMFHLICSLKITRRNLNE